MSNIVHLIPKSQTGNRGLSALGRLFVGQRRAQGDVFWLKENAEWLGILSKMGRDVPAAAIEPYAEFYHSLPAQLTFFPQYYRFFLSICLDLEDLGMGGNHAEALCHWAASRGLPEAELSDLQRAEARRLLARRGVGPQDAGLKDRLHRFIGRSETFALPNKKAAYELAHIVFYLSDYGRSDPGLRPGAITSLEYAGLLAFLDQNADLLAEICAALRFSGCPPNLIWEDFVWTCHATCQMSPLYGDSVADGYHAYLVTGWLTQLSGITAFCDTVPEGPVAIHSPSAGQGALRDLSQGLFNLGLSRSADWARMRRTLLPTLGDGARGVLDAAERSTSKFEVFFERFSRAAGG